MAYYTLLSQSGTSSHWHIEFGDHDKECVEQEMKDSYSHILKRHLKIIKTKTAHQSAINKALAELNAIKTVRINDQWIELSEGMEVVDDGQWQFIQYKGYAIHTMEEGKRLTVAIPDGVGFDEVTNIKAAKKLIDKATS